jgi:hypothetical protein
MALDEGTCRNSARSSCRSYYPGHDVHPMTAIRGDRGGPRTVQAVDDGGTITFRDGTTAHARNRRTGCSSESAGSDKREGEQEHHDKYPPADEFANSLV